MKVLPLEMSPENMTAVLDGEKTETRRHVRSESGRANPLLKLEPGDLVWFKEAINWHPGAPPAVYAARRDLKKVLSRSGAGAPVDMTGRPEDWTPRAERTTPRYMPKWANRACGRVTAVSVEPLRAIDREAARREGIVAFSEINRKIGVREDYFAPYGAFYRPAREDALNAPHEARRGDPVRAFAALWDRLHRNPGRRFHDGAEVVAITFALIEQPVFALVPEAGEG
ncbi:MAG: hypothetical protein ABL308_12780 [Oceanicaulis sp.]